ncbi:four helix bundle protein [candidate division TA06 bacterium]|uniref:Four helix bundle protein n=1 Tax=candidate division TA06 bacterium TaxID=2250710 RepID=A0A933ML00_UNCT6|nr:four helix bundle protein [candidate division TA06 bacterium]
MKTPDKSQPAGARVEPRVIPPHGGYRNLKSYQMAEIVHDATVVFCERFVDRFSRTRDQMVQAARSGKQNIAEGSQVSGTSKASEIKLVGVARASLEELLVDAQDYLRQHALALWGKDDPKAKAVRGLAYRAHRSYATYAPYFDSASPETAANALVCLVHQANYLLDQQLRALEHEVVEKGGFNERLYQARVKYRQGGGCK